MCTSCIPNSEMSGLLEIPGGDGLKVRPFLGWGGFFGQGTLMANFAS